MALLCEALKMQSPSPAQAPLVQGMLQAVSSLEHQIDGLFQALEVPTAAAVAAPPSDGAEPAHRQVCASPPVSTPVSAPSRQPAGAGPASLAPRSLAASGDSARGRRLVVVDDDDAARVGLVLLLEAWGAEVLALASVASVRDWLAQRPTVRPDLVILDYHLPRPGEGLEALRLMRAAWPGQVLRALLITGDDRAALSNALSDGSLECLIKPVLPSPLLQAMQRQLAA